MSTNPKDAIGLTKPQLHLVPPALSLHVSQAMADGAKKYGAYNWRERDVRLTVYIAAAMRHLFSLLDGEDRARDSGHLHAAHVAACMAIILDAGETGNLIDDRPMAGPASDLIDELTLKPQEPAKIEKVTEGTCTITLTPGAWGMFVNALDEQLDRQVEAYNRTAELDVEPEDTLPDSYRYDKTTDTVIDTKPARPVRVGDKIVAPGYPEFVHEWSERDAEINDGPQWGKNGWMHADGAAIGPEPEPVQIPHPDHSCGAV